MPVYDIRAELASALGGRSLKKVLLLPPDTTRAHSFAGEVTRELFSLLEGCHIDVMPALGTHDPMTKQECADFLGVPYTSVIHHDWRAGIARLGDVPAALVSELSGGLMNEPIPVEVNRLLLDPSYNLIVSIGQVVPHEVAGMANYSKNIFVGCGGDGMINATHILSAYHGIERTLGRTDTPVRAVLDYAEDTFIASLPLLYVMTVVSGDKLSGLFIGRGRRLFEQAAALSRKENIIYAERPFHRVLARLPAHEYKSTWLANKAIYRLRLALAPGARLVVSAPGVARFGEDARLDRLIRKYGYRSREEIIGCIAANEDLRSCLSAAAHIMHSSPEGAFTVTYATPLVTREEMESVGFGYMGPEEADAFAADCDAVIDNPALGLWALRERLAD
ncbi:MAG: lactate racemase domain-containing protein [Oscillospiraceae bacterium]|jgi:nickel-dependent lactate racemase|nr:lactate racemase domain-containing protein [Oscillospiraceae bacterium]